MTLTDFVHTLNTWGEQRLPFFFMIDFEMNKPVAIPLADVDAGHVVYSFNGKTNVQSFFHEPVLRVQLNKTPFPSSLYQSKFDIVYAGLAYGDSYLTNLTIKTEISLNCSLYDLFFVSKAKYKLWYDDEFLCFSPETFVRICDGKIFTYPMKGTIDATIPDAEAKILNDTKELAEHVTIVDLLRNDLSAVASHVSVAKFRFLDRIKTNDKNLLQVSSEIVGQLAPDYRNSLGNIIVSMLPAGSVSGAPKTKTLQIIQKAEGEARGYYTWICGYYDGTTLDSAVMIRFIEKSGDKLWYRSGGGITTQSSAEKEYHEALDKVYVPVD